MLRYITRRLGLSLITLVLVSVIVFFAMELLPGDIATQILGREATEETLALLRAELGLDRPALQRYLDWLGGAVQGDFGRSIGRDVPVTELIAERLRNTVLLSGMAALVGIPLAILLGLLAGLTRDRAPDIVISVAALIGMSLPEFVVGSLLILVFAVFWSVFPAVTTATPSAPIGELLPNLVLPAATLTIVMVAYVIRMVRTSLIDVMAGDYVQMATLKGAPHRQVVLRHALPNALIPSINVIALTIAWLAGGVVVVETVFNYPGIGRLMVTAVYDRDIPLVQALALLAAGLYIAINLLADMLTLALNPRLRTMRG